MVSLHRKVKWAISSNVDPIWCEVIQHHLVFDCFNKLWHFQQASSTRGSPSVVKTHCRWKKQNSRCVFWQRNKTSHMKSTEQIQGEKQKEEGLGRLLCVKSQGHGEGCVCAKVKCSHRAVGKPNQILYNVCILCPDNKSKSSYLLQ